MNLWVPEASLVSDHAARPFALQVQDWSERWFHSRPWQVKGRWGAEQRGCDVYQTVGKAGKIMIKGKESATLSLALGILDEGYEDSLTELDREVLEQLGRKALADLTDRISNFSSQGTRGRKQPSKLAHQRRLQLHVGRDGFCPLFFEAGEDDLCALVYDSLPRSDLSAPLASAADVRDSVPVEVSARLGTAKVSLPDIKELTVGDVLILNTRLGEPATLLVEDKPTRLKCGVIETQDERVLKLLEPQ